MRKQILILIGLFTIGISLIRITEKTQAQTVIEVACPAGQSPLQAFTTRNPSTGGIRQYGCVDINGLVYLNIGVLFNNTSGGIPPTSGVVLLTPTSGQTITQPNTGNVPFIINSTNGGDEIFRVSRAGTTWLTVNGVAGSGGGVNVGAGKTFSPGTTTVASLPSAATFIGSMMRVSDSTAVATEGQVCVGSSTTMALAFSDGTNWKCF